MIYFVQMGKSGPIKIGFVSGDLKARLSGVQVGCPEELYLLGVIAKNGTLAKERELHAKFRHLRVRDRGEWFRPEPDLLEFISANAHDPEANHEAMLIAIYTMPVLPRPLTPAYPELDQPPQPKVAMRRCSRCDAEFPSREGDKYCKSCGKAVLTELREKGYFTNVPRRTHAKADNLYRSDNDGDPSPWQENNVRAMEGD